MKLSSFQWMKFYSCLCLCSNWILFNKKYTSSLSKGNFSTANRHLFLSGGGKMGRRKGTNHYRITYTEHRRNTSRGETELMPQTEVMNASKAFWQHWCILRLWTNDNADRSSCESKLEKIVCWERSSTREELPVADEMHVQKVVHWRNIVKVSSGIFSKRCLEFSCAAMGYQNGGQVCLSMVLVNRVVWDFHQTGKFLWHLCRPVRIANTFNTVIRLKNALQENKNNSQHITQFIHWNSSGFANVCLMCARTVDFLVQ